MGKVSNFILSFFFMFSFLSFTIAPSILMLLDNDSELIEIYTSAEEEDNTDENKFENDVVLEDLNPKNSAPSNSKNEKKSGYKYYNYPKPHLNLVFPPPELS